MKKTDKNEPNKPKVKPKKAILPEDAGAWEKAISDVKPLKNRKKYEKTSTSAKILEKTKKPLFPEQSVSRPVQYEESTDDGSVPGTGLDTRTDERLRRGQMPIEGRLDLHGLTQEQARTALRNFIVGWQQQGKRCVLVITGKGSMKGGVLKQKVPEWLWEPPLRTLVLRFYPAKPQHGGDGALYVLLKRNRD